MVKIDRNRLFFLAYIIHINKLKPLVKQFDLRSWWNFILRGKLWGRDRLERIETMFLIELPKKPIVFLFWFIVIKI
jgi:hypothetical protein